MKTKRIVKNVFLAIALLVIPSIASADDRQTQSLAREVAQDAVSLKMSLKQMNGRRNYRRGRRGINQNRGLGVIISAVKSVAQNARQFARSRNNTFYSFAELKRSFSYYQSVSYAIQNNPRLSYEVNSLNQSMRRLQYEVNRGGQGERGQLQKAKKLSNRLRRITSNLASSLNDEFRYGGYETYAEREAMRAAGELVTEASRFSRVVQNSRPALRKAKKRFQHLKTAMKETKRALSKVVTSYTISEKLKKAKNVMRKLAKTLNTSRQGRPYIEFDQGFDYEGNYFSF